MKRPTKKLPDVDQRSRTRREVPNVDPRPTVEARFMDGPMVGQTRLVARGADIVTVGPWVYTRAGKDGRTPLYCRRLKSRRDRKLCAFATRKRKADPRLVMAQAKKTPVEGTKVPKQGKGAMERAAKRALAAGQAAWRGSDGYNGR